jgi:hypothetical protein
MITHELSLMDPGSEDCSTPSSAATPLFMAFVHRGLRAVTAALAAQIRGHEGALPYRTEALHGEIFTAPCEVSQLMLLTTLEKIGPCGFQVNYVFQDRRDKGTVAQWRSVHCFYDKDFELDLRLEHVTSRMDDSQHQALGEIYSFAV